jgi:glycosyltransferase involved in cell wall biosynthesis
MISIVPLTVLIPTLNEEENLEILLPKLQWAGEILIVDSYSQDRTLKVAAKYGAKTIQRTYDNPAAQKNFGMDQASHSWILLLDADEIPDNDLMLDIEKITSKPIHEKSPWAYVALRKQIFLGKTINYSGWQNDWIVRLIQRDKLRYPSSEVHETFSLESQHVARLKGVLYHYTCPTLSFFIDKQLRYAKMAAREKNESTGTITIFHLWIKPCFRFFKHYMLKLGFMDGIRGLVISTIMAFQVHMRYAFLMELRYSKKSTKSDRSRQPNQGQNA